MPGSYHGGSTIYYRGRLNSSDPAEERKSSDDRSSKESVKASKPPSALYILDFVIDRHLRQDNLPLPKDISTKLRDLIQQHTSPFEWARQHKNFNERLIMRKNAFNKELQKKKNVELESLYQKRKKLKIKIDSINEQIKRIKNS